MDVQVLTETSLQMKVVIYENEPSETFAFFTSRF